MSITRITVTAQINNDTHLNHWHNPTLDEACVQVGTDAGLGLWASDPDDLERLAAELTAAANLLRTNRAAKDAA